MMNFQFETVQRGNKPLFKIKQAIEDLYAKPDFSDADGKGWENYKLNSKKWTVGMQRVMLLPFV